jgi:hypothetical protein
MKVNESMCILSTIPSIDIDESNDVEHRPLAPLASSETFTDVISMAHDPIVSSDIDLSVRCQKVNRTTKSDFDSLEFLFDFPSSGISSDTQLELIQSSPSSNHIRFADNDQIISINNKVKNDRRLLSFLFNIKHDR